MGHASYFRSILEKEESLQGLNSVINELNSRIEKVSTKLEKGEKNFQRINLATELKALKLVLSFGNNKIKELKED